MDIGRIFFNPLTLPWGLQGAVRSMVPAALRVVSPVVDYVVQTSRSGLPFLPPSIAASDGTQSDGKGAHSTPKAAPSPTGLWVLADSPLFLAPLMLLGLAGSCAVVRNVDLTPSMMIGYGVGIGLFVGGMLLRAAHRN